MYHSLSIKERWHLVRLMESLAKSNIGIWIGSYVLITKKTFVHYILSLIGLFLLLLNFNRKMKKIRNADAAFYHEIDNNNLQSSPSALTLIFSTKTTNQNNSLDNLTLTQFLPTDVFHWSNSPVFLKFFFCSFITFFLLFLIHNNFLFR